MMLLLLSCLAVLVLGDRMDNAEFWTLRSLDDQRMTTAFLGNATFPAVVDINQIYHVIRTVGDFGPGLIALEYDRLVTSVLNILFGVRLVYFNKIAFDPSTTRWLDNNTLAVYYSIYITTGLDFSTGQYGFTNQEFRFKELIVFAPDSSLIVRSTTIQDTDADAMFALTTGTIAPEFVASFIFGACNRTWYDGVNYLSATGYSNMTDAITFLKTVDANPSPCPFGMRSNTTACRFTHAATAFLGPNPHCGHTHPTHPGPCSDTCIPACANCGANAQCVGAATTPSSSISYKCQCNDGFLGDGVTCKPASCSTSVRCPAQEGSYDCTNGQCLCKKGYTTSPDSSSDLCQCNAPSRVVWMQGERLCLPEGRCINDTYRQFCPQNYNEVKCLPMMNLFHPLGKCQCNPGFSGSFEFDCFCPKSKSNIWSDAVAGKVCLAPGECTLDTHTCSHGQTCSVATDQIIGQCVTSQKRHIY